jgi:hypothetical protein
MAAELLLRESRRDLSWWGFSMPRRLYCGQLYPTSVRFRTAKTGTRPLAWSGAADCFGAMPHYRVYTLAAGNQIVAPPDVIECETDKAAIIEAMILLDGLDVEVWEGARFVTRLRVSDK